MFNRLYKEIALAEEREFEETALDNMLSEDAFDELVLEFMEPDLMLMNEAKEEEDIIDEEDFEEEEVEDVDIEELLENVFDIM